MTKRKIFLSLTIGSILLTGLLLGAFGLKGLLFWQKGNLYTDPEGRFTIELGPGWQQLPTDQPWMQFQLADPPLKMYLIVLETGTVDEAFSRTVEILGFDPDLLSSGAVARIEDWQVYSKEDSTRLSHGLAGQMVAGRAYIMAVKADSPGVSIENPAVFLAMTSLKIAGREEIAVKSFADLETLVQKQIDSRSGSISVLVLHRGEVVYTYTHGEADPLAGIPADARTIYRFGSMTKPFTATALMQLVEKDLVSLDAWPGEYVPEFPAGWKVTVRQLLDHSACLADSLHLTDALIAKPGESFAPLEEIFSQYVIDYPGLVCQPGEASQYSNPHFLALARIIEEVSGKRYEDYIIDHILVPLEMDSTRFEVVEARARYAKGQWPIEKTDELIAQLNEYRGPGQEDLVLGYSEAYSTWDDFRVLPPWGGLFGTTSDIAHFLQMNLQGGRYGDVQVLEPKTVTLMQKMQVSTNGSPLGFSLGWIIGEDDRGKFLFHGGSGHTIETSMRFYPRLDLGIVVMSNFNGSQAEKIAEGLVSAWSNEK